METKTFLFFFSFFSAIFLNNQQLVSCENLLYTPGNCRISISSLLHDIVQSELRAVLQPRFRYSSEKLLRFDLYTLKNPLERQILTTGDTISLATSNFNPKWPVRFSIHGWMGNSLTCSNAAVKDAYLSRGNFNVFIVDWSAHAVDVSYSRISEQLSSIARHLVKFIEFLHHETGVAYEEVYLIGHSAGAHIAGWVGKMLQPPRQLGAIVALDPAGLVQLGLNESHRLAPYDAIYVESAHTDIRTLGNPSTNLSQAAFFPNWGLGQPQCPNATAAEFDFACDHFASLYYFAQSVRSPQSFGALRCDRGSLKDFSCNCPDNGAAKQFCKAEAYFGGEPLTKKSGIFYFSTKRQVPFGYGDFVVKRAPQSTNFFNSIRRNILTN